MTSLITKRIRNTVILKRHHRKESSKKKKYRRSEGSESESLQEKPRTEDEDSDEDVASIAHNTRKKLMNDKLLFNFYKGFLKQGSTLDPDRVDPDRNLRVKNRDRDQLSLTYSDQF